MSSGVSLSPSLGSAFLRVGLTFGQGFPWGEKDGHWYSSASITLATFLGFWKVLDQRTGLTQITCPSLWPGAQCAPGWPSLSPMTKPVPRGAQGWRSVTPEEHRDHTQTGRHKRCPTPHPVCHGPLEGHKPLSHLRFLPPGIILVPLGETSPPLGMHEPHEVAEHGWN